MRFIGEVDATVHAGDRGAGLNPVNPVDLEFGVRVYANRSLAASAAYRLSVTRIAEDHANQVFPRELSGFLVQLRLGTRNE